MDLEHDTPLRCPKCNALVVERRSPICTTCHESLPTDWVLSRSETAHLTAMDAHAKFKHAQSMERLSTDPDKPEMERIGEATEEELT